MRVEEVRPRVRHCELVGVGRTWAYRLLGLSGDTIGDVAQPDAVPVDRGVLREFVLQGDAEHVAGVGTQQGPGGRITGHRETIDVQGLLLAAATGSQDAYSRTGVDLLTSGPPTPTSINADARRLGQVLTNLLDNALRHSHAGQSVRLSAQVSHSEIEVSVADQGDGISSEQLIHVFERFYRADSARHRTGHGSGIGLTISKAIVEAHDGRIRAESAGVGRGTTITFALPIA